MFSKPLLDVLTGRKPDRRPLWLMRQAGRYLPEYREIRSKSKNFLNMCLTPDLATEVTLQPLRRFDLDAAILFADILLVPLAMGVALDFREGEGPVLERIESKKIDRLSYDSQKLAPVFETIRRVKQDLPEKKTLIGFCGAPWTVACYMIDGTSKKNFIEAKRWSLDQPESLDLLIDRITQASETYLAAQIDAGVEVVQIFDSWAGLLQGDAFMRFVIEPTRQLVMRLKKRFPHIPIIGFPREAGDGYSPYIRETGVDALGLDPFVDLQKAKIELQPIKPLQGNLDPALLLRGGEEMKGALENIMTLMGPNHILNLGHGVLPQTPVEHVSELVRIVREFES